MTTTAQGSGGTRRVFDGDATVDGVLGASGLPRELQDLVRLVVSRCRLSKREKSRAAAMLCDRVAGQLDAGRTVQQITGELGAPRVVARTLSKEVRRSRPLSVRIFRRGVQGVVLCVLLLIAVYGYYFVRFNFGTPNIARNFAQEHNDRVLARPEAERAWPIYRQLLPGWKHVASSKEEGTENYPDLEPGTPGWDAAVAIHKANAAAIETIRRAARLPVMGCLLREDPDPFLEVYGPGIESGPVVDSPASVAGNPPLIVIAMHHIGVMRSFTRTLRFEAFHAAVTGDGRRATDSVSAMLGLATQLRDAEIWIAEIVSAAITSMGLDTLGMILARFPEILSDDQLSELGAILRPAPGIRNPYKVSFAMERQTMLDLLQRSFSDNGSGDGVLVAEGVRNLESLDIIQDPPGMKTPAGLMTIGPLLSAPIVGREEMWQFYEARVQATEKYGDLPLWERHERLAEPMAGKKTIQRFRLFLADMLSPRERDTISPEMVLQDRDAVRTAIALEQFRRARGAWPTALSELVPAYLPEVLPDHYTGKPLGYVIIDGKPRLYSVGVDRVDDGGTTTGEATDEYSRKWMSASEAASKIAQLQSGTRVPGLKEFRGDWILWPQPPASVETDTPAPSTEPTPSEPAE